MPPTLRRLAVTVTLLLVGTITPAVAQEAPEDGSESDGADAKIVRDLPPRDPAPDEAVQKLRRRIDGIIDQKVPPQVAVGIHAVDTATGQVLYQKNARRPLNPASNMKLLTSAAALDVFEPHHSFGTQIVAEQPTDGVVDGPLYLVGEGEAFLLFENFIKWAAELKMKGIESVEGGIVVDDGAFDEDYLPPGFDQKDEDDSFRSPIGAVSVNFNAVSVIVEPADETGKEPSIRFFPPNDHLELVNKARTVGGSSVNLDYSSDPNGEGTTEIVVEGSIGTGAQSSRERLRIDHPPAFAGSVLAKALEMVGITVDGEVRRGTAPDSDDSETLVSHYSQPLSFVVQAMNKWSNNFMAEQLLRTLGGTDGDPSTWAKSRDKMDEFLENAGLDTSKITVKNGSGLYDGNGVSAQHFVRLLTYMLDHRAAPEFVSSLAVAGRDGTLKRRLRGSSTAGNVRAKTGTLNDVSALSGYLETASGRRVAFSILLNDTPRKAWLYRPVQDKIVEALAAFDK